MRELVRLGPVSLRMSAPFDLRIGAHLRPWQTGSAELQPDLVVELRRDPAPSSWAPLSEGGGLGRFRWAPGSRCVEASIADGPAAEWTALRTALNVAAWKAGGLMLHATGLLRGPGQCVAALAVSGGGKSTLTDLAEGWHSLSDETVLVTMRGEPTAHATPFRSSARKAPAPASCALSALLLLEKSPVPFLERAPVESALASVLSQLYRPPTSVASSAEILRRAKLLAEAVPAYRFRFPKSPAAKELLERLFEEEP